jgi:predicted Zn-dependent protease
MNLRRVFIAALGALWLAPATAMAMSEKKEIGIGREMHQEILAKVPVYANAAVADYVGRIGQQLARDSDRPGLEYTFTVLDSPDINAFATPGGYVYINRGLLAYLQSEAELAAVLAHEIAHITELVLAMTAPGASASAASAPRQNRRRFMRPRTASAAAWRGRRRRPRARAR